MMFVTEYDCYFGTQDPFIGHNSNFGEADVKSYVSVSWWTIPSNLLLFMLLVGVSHHFGECKPCLQQLYSDRALTNGPC